MHRVQKLLSNYGYCSRRKAEKLIEEGKVKVNDKVISIGDKASLQDKIYVDGKLVVKEKKVYLMLNKPVGCVTALKDDKYKTVMKYIKINERVFPIGRLDYNTSGLLLFTNDGDFANKVMHPRYEIKKTYRVTLYNPILKKKIESIEKGVTLDDGKTRPAEVKKISENIIEIVIHEGKNRIVRRMLKKLGLKVRFLERVKVGGLGLNGLEEGEYKDLSKKDLDKIFN